MMVDDRGSVSVEFAAGAALTLMLVITTLITAGRIVMAQAVITDVATAAARSASIARTAGQAERDANATAQQVLTAQQLHCQRTTVAVDTSGFSVPVGLAASVRVEVTCVMSRSPTLSDSFVSPLDPYRGRT
jgi:Flp pilus assembly protein TadG